jgi:hypothetical protein
MTTNMKRPQLLEPNGSIVFPYETFPWRLEFTNTVCYFECEEHLQKYLDRYNMKPKDIKVLNRDGKSLKSSQKHKKSVEQTTGKISNRSSGTVRKRKSSVDSTRNSTRSTKSKGKK